MENAVEALKIAFAVMMFVMALTLSISSFSQANEAVTSLISMNDRENEYTYVEPSQGLTRTVGIETVVTSMYRGATEQNIEIYFKDNTGKLIPLFYETRIDTEDYIEKDSSGNPIEICSIDFSNVKSEAILESGNQIRKMDIDIILAGTSKIENIVKNYLNGQSEETQNKYINMYEEKIKDHFPDGLYDEFKDKKFIESFGEYTEYEGTANEYTQRVITYQIQ